MEQERWSGPRQTTRYARLWHERAKLQPRCGGGAPTYCVMNSAVSDTSSRLWGGDGGHRPRLEAPRKLLLQVGREVGAGVHRCPPEAQAHGLLEGEGGKGHAVRGAGKDLRVVGGHHGTTLPRSMVRAVRLRTTK